MGYGSRTITLYNKVNVGKIHSYLHASKKKGRYRFKNKQKVDILGHVICNNYYSKRERKAKK